MVIVEACTTSKDNGEITVEKDIYIDKCEVTIEEYTAFCNAQENLFHIIKAGGRILNQHWLSMLPGMIHQNTVTC